MFKRVMKPKIFGICGVTLALLYLGMARAKHWEWEDIPSRTAMHAAGVISFMSCEVRSAIHGIHSQHDTSNPYKCQVAEAVAEYRTVGYSYKAHLQQYEPLGNWLNYDKTETWKQKNGIRVDRNGIPMVVYRYQRTYYYNPVTIENYALHLHGRYLDGDANARDQFLKAADKILDLQDSSGAFRYPFAFTSYPGCTHQKGWASGMAQGMGLAVLARAYQLTNDRRYLDGGDRAFDYMLVPIAQGGVLATLGAVNPSLAQDLIFEEYPSTPPQHTLNGFLFALLGIYDWSLVSERRSQEARSRFEQGVESVRRILPYYDLKGFSAYDLTHITYGKKPRIGVSYHAVHIFLLHALATITKDPKIEHYEQLWASYVPQ